MLSTHEANLFGRLCALPDPGAAEIGSELEVKLQRLPIDPRDPCRTWRAGFALQKDRVFFGLFIHLLLSLICF